MKLKQVTVTSISKTKITSKVFYISVLMRTKILQENKLILDLFLLFDKFLIRLLGRKRNGHLAFPPLLTF